MNKKTWIIFIAVVVVVFAGLVVWSQRNRIDVSKVDHTMVTTSETAEQQHAGLADNTLGSKQPKLTLIEYGDYSCPGCANFDGILRSVMQEDKYKNNVQYVFRHFPITTIHPNSRAAAAYAEAAGLQGKYWPMHHKLFSTYRTWLGVSSSERDKLFTSYAKELGLNTDQLAKDITSDKINRKITHNQQVGKQNGVSGTPSFFLNGKSLGADKVEDANALRQVLDKAIADAK